MKIQNICKMGKYSTLKKNEVKNLQEDEWDSQKDI